MNIKRFVAASSREALRLVRNELGPDAVILSNRKLEVGVEIVAVPHTDLEYLENKSAEVKAAPWLSPGREAPQPAPKIVPETRARAAAAPGQPVAAPANPAPPQAALPAQPVRPIAADNSLVVQGQQGILSEIKSMRDLLQEQLACLVWSDVKQRDPKRSTVLRNLLNSGFSPELLRKLLDKMPSGEDMSWAGQVLKNNLRIIDRENDMVACGGVYALVGPTGVGKTTTTAKLAARAVVRYGAGKVALITTDSYRIGAFEQLRIYGKILGVEVHAVRDAEDLRMTLATLKQKHLVLIDTMGMGQRDSRVSEQADMLNACGARRLLLLNATSGGDTLDDVVNMYGGAGMQGCILTKLDEAVRLGTVLDVVVRHRLVLHYIANGQRVPEDLHEVNLEYLLHRTLKFGGRDSPFTVNELEIPALMAGGAAKKGKAAHAR